MPGCISSKLFYVMSCKSEYLSGSDSLYVSGLSFLVYTPLKSMDK